MGAGKRPRRAHGATTGACRVLLSACSWQCCASNRVCVCVCVCVFVCVGGGGDECRVAACSCVRVRAVACAGLVPVRCARRHAPVLALCRRSYAVACACDAQHAGE
jgi:hypothetical protein